jgi:hypothetical protein
MGLGQFFSFVILYIVDRIPWTGDQSVSRSQDNTNRIIECGSNPRSQCSTSHATNLAATVTDQLSSRTRKYGDPLFLWIKVWERGGTQPIFGLMRYLFGWSISCPLLRRPKMSYCPLVAINGTLNQLHAYLSMILHHISLTSNSM